MLIDKNKLEESVLKYEFTLSLHDWHRVAPFSCMPKVNVEDDCINIIYALDTDTIKKIKYRSDEKFAWYILPTKNIYLRFVDYEFANLRPSIKPSLHGNLSEPKVFLSDEKVPIYIRSLIQIAGEYFDSNLITIIDYLPIIISFRIYKSTDLQSPEVMQGLLYNIVDFAILEANYDKKFDSIFNDTTKTFEEKFDDLIALNNKGVTLEDSLCLACGETIKKGRKFCNADGKINKDNCLNKFNYWIRNRLNIKSTEGVAKKREELHLQLEELITNYPLTGYAKFKIANEKLFSSKYKERWRKHKGIRT
jgi:hypothetical protein